MTSRLMIIYRDGLWHVVREDARAVSLYSTSSAALAAEWREAHATRRAA